MASYDGFYDAATARQIASGGGGGNTIVLGEINALQAAINAAAVNGELEATITNSTTMTTGAVYYEAWTDSGVYKENEHRIARERMAHVVNYFTRLGYAIKREREGVEERFEWVIRW